MKSIYYAHCMALYDTPQEQRDVLTLQAMGFRVLNPNEPDVNRLCDQRRKEAREAGSPDPSEEVMKIFRALVSCCDFFAFRALPDGRIPAGVAKELAWAREFGLPVIELPGNVAGRVMSVDATREYLQEVGQR